MAIADAAHSWNWFRTSRPGNCGPNSAWPWTDIAYYGRESNLWPLMNDGVNVVFFADPYNFDATNPWWATTANSAPCRQALIDFPDQFSGMTCIISTVWPGSEQSLTDFAIFLNVRTPGGWTTRSWASQNWRIIQDTFTHEFGHALGLGHVGTISDPSQLTMWTGERYSPAGANAWRYTLGNGDMTGSYNRRSRW